MTDKAKQVFDPSKYAGKGTDTIDPSDLGMPFLKILQDGSPEIKRTHPKHEQAKIDGAEAGDIVYAPEKILFKKGVRVIPLAVKTVYGEWRPLDQGGGFIGHHPLSVATDREDYSREENKEYLGANELVRTTYFCVNFLDEESNEWKRGVIAFTSTQLQKARHWNKMILSFRYKDHKEIKPPIFACSYLLSSKPESNNQGSWFGWQITQEGVLEDVELLEMASEGVDHARAELPAPVEQEALPEGETEAF